ncbi:MAG: glycosyltransferase [Herminiimonas sp.]|nr:glycosyltransferase [Herminiimonas sp.]
MTANNPDSTAITATTDAKPPPLVSVVLSFYNEATVLPALIERLRTTLREERSKGYIRDYELVFINDSSTDLSLDILMREFNAGNDLVIINMSNNFGVSECVLAGMSYSKGDAVVYMDADLQDPPELLPELIARWRSDPDVEVVYTTRLSRAGEHPLKLFVTKWGYRFINSVSQIELPVDSGDFKLLSRRVVNELVQLREKNPFVRGLVSWVGFKQAQVFYHREERADGREQTKRSAMSMKVINYWLDTALISFSDAPLKAMLFIGFVISLTSLGYIFVVLFQKIMGWYEPGWPALMAAILLLGGMQLLTLGVLGLYINTIFMNTRGRPNYIVKNVTAPDERNTQS